MPSASRSRSTSRAADGNHVWASDFVEDRTYDGRKYRMFCILDECTCECLKIRVARRLNWSSLRNGFEREGGLKNAKVQTHGSKECREAAQIDVLTSQGKPIAGANQSISVTDVM